MCLSAWLFVCSCTKIQILRVEILCASLCFVVFLWSFGKGFSGATVSMQVPEGVAL